MSASSCGVVVVVIVVTISRANWYTVGSNASSHISLWYVGLMSMLDDYCRSAWP